MFVFVPRHILIPETLTHPDEAVLVAELKRLAGDRAKITINNKHGVMATSNDLTYKIGTIHKARVVEVLPHNIEHTPMPMSLNQPEND